MKKADLLRKLREIKEKGFVMTMRIGSTGVGYTLEKLLGVSENNLAIPDIGGRIEIKATREGSSNYVTLFTFNKGVWVRPLKEIIKTHGYLDANGRLALKRTLFYNTDSGSLTIKLRRDDIQVFIDIVDLNNNLLGSYNLFNIQAKFLTKLSTVLFCVAETKIIDNLEHFYYKKFYILSNPTPERFIKAFEERYVGIDLRMHLKENGSVRNRGTAFRVKENHFLNLYERVEELPI